MEFAVDPAKFHEVFAADLTAKQADVLAATQRPVSELAFSEPNGTPAWKSLPSWAVVATSDKAAGADITRSMAQRAGATITELEGSHVIMISTPGGDGRHSECGRWSQPVPGCHQGDGMTEFSRSRYSTRMPRFCTPWAAICARLRAPSLRRMDWTWPLTVRTVMSIDLLMSLSVRPLAINPTTCSSRSVRAGGRFP